MPEELTRVPKTADFIEASSTCAARCCRWSISGAASACRRCERNDRQRIMVFTIRGVRTGFIVDSVSEVMRISASVIGASPTLSEEQQRLIRRVANIERHNRMILLLDVDQLLDVKELDAVGTTVSH